MRVCSLTLLLTLITLVGNAQISISFPMEKAVFQRNTSNQANLSIAGNYSSAINSVEAQLKNYANNSVAIGWTTISNSPSNGIFQGTLSNVQGGWYILEVRGKLNGNVVGNIATLQRVGVGEVFIIAGQSNSQGQPGNYAEVGATDERVLSHNETTFLNGIGQCDLNFPNYPAISQIYNDGNTKSYISKTGYNPWCYGKLGDLLVSKLGVPVVFFNAGYEGSTSQNWRQSADGFSTTSYYSGQQYCQAIGAPYYGLKRVLNYYASIFGARAVLWHQGETDNQAGVGFGDYYNNVEYVINKSRSDLGSTIPWVISRATVFDKNANGGNGNPNSDIINAQIALANNGSLRFSGPSTDDILGGNRLDQVHFYGSGLIELANRWNSSLDANFFNNASPVAAKPLPNVAVTCLNTSTFRLTAPAGYASYKWVRPDLGNTGIENAAEATSQIIDRSAGTYRCYLTDYQGNVTFTQATLLPDVATTCSTPPPPACTGLTSCSGITYLSNSPPCSSTNGWGPIEMDKSNGENATGDGNTISLKGVPYSKGIGVHAVSEIIYKLNGNFGRFISDIGVDDEVAGSSSTASVIYKVYKDNVLAYTSPLITKNTPTIRLNIPTSGTNELKMVVEDGGDNNYFDHVDWAGARLHCATTDNQAPNAPTGLTENNVGQSCVTLSWTPATDNIEVDKYNIYQDGNFIGSINSPFTNFYITGLSPLNYYTFTIRAVDFSGNVSSDSNLLEIVTLQNPFISITNKVVNVGQSTQLLLFGCNGGTVYWSTGANTNPINVSPTDTTIYSATCVVGSCVSMTVQDTVKVIPNCKSVYSLVKNKDNLSGSTTNLIFSASQTISATNIISSQATVAYKAAKSVTLLPGFQANSSTVFSATIGGCVNGARVGVQIIPPPESQPADKSKLTPIIEKEK
jgi:chitodextrinase